MAGAAIIAVAILVGFITGVFSKVPNQVISDGQIISIEYQYDTDESKPTYSAIVEYEAAGRLYSIKSRYRSSTYHTGQMVRVAYNAENPQNAVIRPTLSNYVVFTLLFVAGVIIFFASLRKG